MLSTKRSQQLTSSLLEKDHSKNMVMVLDEVPNCLSGKTALREEWALLLHLQAHPATKNPNQIENINFPADIEGLWTYVYYSYSSDENKAVAHIKYGNQEIQTKTLPTTHQMTKLLRFILGGNDEKRYPGSMAYSHQLRSRRLMAHS